MIFMFLLFLIMTLSFMFFYLNHPLTLGLILMIQTVLIALITGIQTKSFWFSYSLFLIFLGGMLILFMYMTSLASNEIFKFSLNFKTLIIIFPLILCFLILDWKTLIFNKTINLENSNYTNFKWMFLESNLMLNKMYNFSFNYITLLMINYLFLTLIATVKMTNIFKGPLRTKNY